MKFIKAEVIVNDQENDEGGADTDGKPHNVYKGKDLITPEVADGDEQVVFQHKRAFTKDTTDGYLLRRFLDERDLPAGAADLP
jgi:hypothetical protein